MFIDFSKKIGALSTQYFLTTKFKSHNIVNSYQKNLWQNQILKRSRHESNIVFSKKHIGTIFNLDKCSLHEVLFERKAEITLKIPDLDNASEGRENTRLRVTPELFYNATPLYFYPSCCYLKQDTAIYL